MSRNNGKAPRIEVDLEESTTFISLILRPAGTDKEKEIGFDYILTGWCIIAAHGLAAALRHVEKIQHGIDLKGAVWTDIKNGKTTKLANGHQVQVMAAPMYINEEPPEPKIVQPSMII